LSHIYIKIVSMISQSSKRWDANHRESELVGV